MATDVFGDDDKNHYIVLHRNLRKLSEKDELLINSLVSFMRENARISVELEWEDALATLHMSEIFSRRNYG